MRRNRRYTLPIVAILLAFALTAAASAQAPGGYDCRVQILAGGAFDAHCEPDATPTAPPTATETPIPTNTATVQPSPSVTPTAPPSATATLTPVVIVTATVPPVTPVTGLRANVPLIDAPVGDPGRDANNWAIISGGAISPSGGYWQMRLAAFPEGLRIYLQIMQPQPSGRVFVHINDSVHAEVAFPTTAGWDVSQRAGRGWSASATLPWARFTDAGERPQAGTAWPLSVSLGDGTWNGVISFGLPAYNGRNVAGAQVLTLPLLADAPVGGNTDCGSDDYPAFFPTWGSRNEDAPTNSAPRTALGTAAQVNIAQAQWDVADWPCYSRYFAAWSLAGLPLGAQVVSATVQMRQFGNPGYGTAYAADGSKDTVVQVYEVTDA